METNCDKLQGKVSEIESPVMRHHKTRIETYVDGSFFVSHQEVPEEPGLVQITEPYHVVHTLHRGGVHGPEGALRLLGDLVLLYMKDLIL